MPKRPEELERNTGPQAVTVDVGHDMDCPLTLQTPAISISFRRPTELHENDRWVRAPDAIRPIGSWLAPRFLSSRSTDGQMEQRLL